MRCPCRRPHLLDVYCGEGGASAGYDRAGFHVVGVDLARRHALKCPGECGWSCRWRADTGILKRYPYQLIQAEALSFLAAADLSGFDLVHLSPPCQRWAWCKPGGSGLYATPEHLARWPDLITPSRAILEERGVPFVIENVPRAPVRPDVVLCGCMFGVPRLRRERWFETSWHAFDMRPPCQHPELVVTVTRKTGRITRPARARGQEWVSYVNLADCGDLMGIGWMSQSGLGEAIPPYYAEHIGRMFLADRG